MTASTFVLSLTVIFVILLVRFRITKYINNNFEVEGNFQSEWIVYILTILFMVVIGMGMLMDDTKSKFGQISEGFENLKPKVDDRPNPLFDINTYW